MEQIGEIVGSIARARSVAQSAGHRTAHEMRFESISKSPREIERKSREDLKSEAGNAVKGQSILEDLPEQLRVKRDTLQIDFVRNVRRE